MLLDTICTDRAIAVVRASRIEHPVALCRALRAGGIRTVEFTFTTPHVEDLISEAGAGSPDSLVGAGTVTNEAAARSAIEAGARFLVTPGVHVDVAAVAHEASVPVLIGALTPTEIMRAVQLGADAIKVFPASLVGPGYLRDLRGPFPTVPFVPSGGIDASGARAWRQAGAIAVTAGSSVVNEADIEAGAWETITERARAFVAAARS